MTVKYEILKRLVKVAGIKKRWLAKSTEELLENRRKSNAKNKIPDLKDDAFTISRIEVMGCPVLKLIHKQPTDRANLFLIGGGMISAPRPSSIRKALRFAKETGLDLFVPYYPLCTDYPLTKAYEMIHATYKEMLKDYAPEHISVLGTSSGGNLALGMVPYIHDGHGDTPMPGYILAISPGTCVDTDEEWQRMLELDEKDVAIPAQYMKTAVEVMRHGDDSVPDYMIWLQKANFTACPKTTFLYGSDETLYACAPSFEAAMQKYGVDYQILVGEGMFHCYPVFPVCKEAKDGWDLMIRLMKENTGMGGNSHAV
ncbi:MAG: alpha/beta hydrolase [Clostridia bacterium]|nr:alpha/beta hydrolase [Clostridia bacterium]